MDSLQREIDETFNEDGIVKPHKEYENKYEICSNKEEFKNYIGNKVKKAWFNNRNKLCLESFILLGQDNQNPDNYVAIKVINGIADQTSKDVYPYTEIFDDNHLVFVGYLKPEQIGEKIRERKAGFL